MNSRTQVRGEGRRGKVNVESSTEAKTPPHVKQPVGNWYESGNANPGSVTT